MSPHFNYQILFVRPELAPHPRLIGRLNTGLNEEKIND